MATMIPRTIDPETPSRAEKALFEAFERALPDGYTVFHGLAWQQPAKRGYIRDGEADFVIMHPKAGVLVLEVKGGAIAWLRESGRWHSRSRGGQVYEIKDPLQQARASKYLLRDLWGDMGLGPEPLFAHAVAFPDSTVARDRALPPDLPRAIVMDNGDLLDPAAWVRGVLDYYRGTMRRGDFVPREESYRRFLERFGGTQTFRPAMWGRIQHEREEMLELTEQQHMALDLLARRRRALVAGIAGSGKTLLAVEKAARLADAGARVLLTCYNKNLAAELRRRLGDREGLRVQHFHELAYEIAEAAGTLPAERSYDETFFMETLPEALLQAIEAGDAPQYDAVIVDEGQDFAPSWWIPLEALLAEPADGILYIFYDAGQELYGREAGFPIEDEPFLLNVNCRNTLEIHKKVMRFAPDPPRHTGVKGVKGRPAQVLGVGTLESTPRAAGAVVQQLTERHQVPIERIVVLSPLSRQRGSVLADKVEIGPFDLTDSIEPVPGKLRCHTIHGFKGCEADVVILIEADRWPNEESRDALLYVACSRARHHLVALLPKEGAEDLWEAFTDEKGGRASPSSG